LKTIRLNSEQRCWVLGYLHTSKDYNPNDPFIQLLSALLERPEVTSIQMRADHPVVQVMIEKVKPL